MLVAVSLCVIAQTSAASSDLLYQRLARCLTAISTRHFTTHGSALHISLPSNAGRSASRHTTSDTHQITLSSAENTALQELHELCRWPILVSLPTDKAKMPTQHDYDARKSYILFTRKEPDNSIRSTITREVKYLAALQSWNPRAMFIAIYIPEDKAEDNSRFVKSILQTFSNFTVVNVVVLISSSAESKFKNMLKDESSTFLTTETKNLTFLEVYTWFPYQSPRTCNRVQNVSLLDKWSLSGEEGFLKNSSVFPQKITRNLNKCPLRIIARVTPVLLVKKPVEQIVSGTKKFVFNDGWEVFFIKVIAKAINMTEEYLPPSEDFDISVNLNGSSSGYTGALVNNIADVAFGAIDIKETATDVTEVTRPYHWDFWAWYVPCAAPNPRWNSIFRVFSAWLWALLCFSVLIVTFIMITIARCILLDMSELYRFLNPISCFFVIVSTIIGISVPVMPSATSLRVFFLSWACFSLAVSTVFQAYLTSFLIDPGLGSQIANLHELLTSGMKYGYLSYLDMYFTNNTESNSKTILTNRVECPDLNLCAQWVGIHRNFSLLYTQILEEYLRSQSVLPHNTDKSLLCGISDGGVVPVAYAMVMSRRSPLLPVINKIVSSIFESGIFLKWTADSFELERIKAKAFQIHSLADDYLDLNLKHMQSAFYVLIFGLALSVITLIMELMYQYIFRN